MNFNEPKWCEMQTALEKKMVWLHGFISANGVTQAVIENENNEFKLVCLTRVKLTHVPLSVNGDETAELPADESEGAA